VVKTILYKRTIALGTSIEYRKDLRRSEPRGDSGGSGWRKEAMSSHAMPDATRQQEGRKVCRYIWHSAGSLGCPFSVLKY